MQGIAALGSAPRVKSIKSTAFPVDASRRCKVAPALGPWRCAGSRRRGPATGSHTDAECVSGVETERGFLSGRLAKFQAGISGAAGTSVAAGSGKAPPLVLRPAGVAWGGPEPGPPDSANREPERRRAFLKVALALRDKTTAKVRAGEGRLPWKRPRILAETGSPNPAAAQGSARGRGPGGRAGGTGSGSPALRPVSRRSRRSKARRCSGVSSCWIRSRASAISLRNWG